MVVVLAGNRTQVGVEQSIIWTRPQIDFLPACCGEWLASLLWSACRAPEGVHFRPYDLNVVPRERISRCSEYFTMSANGVMAIRKGVQAEFVALEAWVRQSSLFDLVSNIGFFKNYLTGRAFRRWHKVC